MKISKHIHNTFIPHKQNQYLPHILRKYGLLSVLTIAVSMQLVFNLQTTGQFKVLGYATNISVGGLLSATNSERANSGLSTLTLDSNLSSAAQSKAQHMIANDYWAHTSPDGLTPWHWIDAVGYNYLKAGENLAYGFATNTDTVAGWMASPGHKANILDGQFKEVGFGIANGDNFQGNENTVVVALYAQPVTVVNDPAPAPSTAQSTTPSSSPIAEEASTAPRARQNKNDAAKASEKDSPEDQSDAQDQSDPQIHRLLARDDSLQVTFGSIENGEVQGSTISNIEAILNGQAHWSFYVTFTALMLVTGAYLVRHIAAMIQLVKYGEHYIVGHPLLEASVIYAAVWLVLLSTYGAVL